MISFSIVGGRVTLKNECMSNKDHFIEKDLTAHEIMSPYSLSAGGNSGEL